VKWRLKACITHNDAAVKETTQKALTSKELLLMLKQSEKGLVSMMTFLDEVSNLKDRETQVRKHSTCICCMLCATLQTEYRVSLSLSPLSLILTPFFFHRSQTNTSIHKYIK
jgi:hypothetical protein